MALSNETYHNPNLQVRRKFVQYCSISLCCNFNFQVIRRLITIFPSVNDWLSDRFSNNNIVLFDLHNRSSQIGCIHIVKTNSMNQDCSSVPINDSDDDLLRVIYVLQAIKSWHGITNKEVCLLFLLSNLLAKLVDCKPCSNKGAASSNPTTKRTHPFTCAKCVRFFSFACFNISTKILNQNVRDERTNYSSGNTLTETDKVFLFIYLISIVGILLASVRLYAVPSAPECTRRWQFGQSAMTCLGSSGPPSVNLRI